MSSTPRPTSVTGAESPANLASTRVQMKQIEAAHGGNTAKPGTPFAELHERMAKSVFLNVELLLNDGVENLSEYDVQSEMFKAFNRMLINTAYRADREKEGKVDCVVFYDNKALAIYELKTYFKLNEKPNKKSIDRDIEKLADKMSDNRNLRAYMIVAGRKARFSDKNLAKLGSLGDILEDTSRRWHNYLVGDKQRRVRMRPSVKEKHGRSVFYSWEVKLP